MGLSAAALQWFEESGIDPTDPLWAGYDPTEDPRYTAFQQQQDAYRPVQQSDSVPAWLAAMDGWIAYLQTIGSDTSREQALIDRVRANPDDFTVQGGFLHDKAPWILQNLWWIGPIAIVGGSALAAYLGATPTAGVLPSSSLTSASTPISSGFFATPAAIASQGVSAAVPLAGAGGLLSAGSLLTGASIDSGLFAAPAAIVPGAVSAAVPLAGAVATTAARTVPQIIRSLPGLAGAIMPGSPSTPTGPNAGPGGPATDGPAANYNSLALLVIAGLGLVVLSRG